MSKIIKQYTDTSLSDKKIYQLGIQAPPGSKIKINNGEPIIVNSTGIFQVECNEDIYITSVEVTKSEEKATVYIDVIEEG